MKVIVSFVAFFAACALVRGQTNIYYSNNVTRVEAIGAASPLHSGMTGNVFAGVMTYFRERIPTNNVSQAEAVRIASRLWVGMSEEDVAKVVDKQNGLKRGFDVEDGIGWTRWYLLSNGCLLDLHMDPKRVDGKWAGNGLLKSASIESNRVKIVSITLTNAP
jgi:hypothetical protein